MLSRGWNGGAIWLTAPVLLTTACLSSGGGGGGNDPESQRIDACLSCGETQCPSEHDACQDLPACAALYDCTVRCPADDPACQNECASDAASDGEAITAATNYSACIATSCLDECAGETATTGAGTPAPTSVPTIPTPAQPTPTQPTPGAPTPGGSSTLCDQLFDWAVGCAVDTQADFQACTEETDFDKCSINCLLGASCAEFDEVSAGEANELSDCVADCAAALGSGSGGPSGVGEGGYYTAGEWSGYAWTATDSTSGSSIMPSDFEALAAGSSLCVDGTVAATSDYSGVAILGINVNQPMGDPAPDPGTWTPTSAGVQYSISNTGGSPLRIQIQAPGGDSDENLRWCAEVVGSSGTIGWSSFNTACWDFSGNDYAGTPLESAMVVVPGDQVTVPFSFCLESLSPL